MLSHTIRGSSVIQNIFINNIPASEFDLNLGIAGQYNVPIGLISGDTDIIREAKKSIESLEKSLKPIETPFSKIDL